MIRPRWSADQRQLLVDALRKAEAGAAQGEVVAMSGAEGRAMVDAAKCWRDLLDHLDGATRAGLLDDLVPSNEG